LPNPQRSGSPLAGDESRRPGRACDAGGASAVVLARAHEIADLRPGRARVQLQGSEDLAVQVIDRGSSGGWLHARQYYMSPAKCKCIDADSLQIDLLWTMFPSHYDSRRPRDLRRRSRPPLAPSPHLPAPPNCTAIPEIGLDLPPHEEARPWTRWPGCRWRSPPATPTAASSRSSPALPRPARRHCVFLRGDMDALPVREETGLDYARRRRHHARLRPWTCTPRCWRARGHAPRGPSRRARRRRRAALSSPERRGFNGAARMIEAGALDASPAPRRRRLRAARDVGPAFGNGVFATPAGAR